MKYKDFEIIYECWKGFQRSVHGLESNHHLDIYHKSLFRMIKNIPEEELQDHLHVYYEKSIMRQKTITS
jgi:hypothetical protein